jgi:hypothetical protein
VGGTRAGEIVTEQTPHRGSAGERSPPSAIPPRGLQCYELLIRGGEFCSSRDDDSTAPTCLDSSAGLAIRIAHVGGDRPPPVVGPQAGTQDLHAATCFFQKESPAHS